MIPKISPSPLAKVPINMPQQVSSATKSFAEVISETIGQVRQSQNAGDQSIQALQSGKAKHLHDVMISVEEADISLRMLVQVRNKALSAYDEIMRMQL